MKRKSYIKRSTYVEKINPFVDKQIIKVLTGQRRVGKSYVLYQLMDSIRQRKPNANIIYIDMELQEFSSIRTDKDLYQYVLPALLPNRSNYLFVDEVQEISSFEKCLRSLSNENKCDIFCTGSNAKMLSGELATLLSGMDSG